MMSISGVKGSFICSSFPSQNHKPFPPLHSSSTLHLKRRPIGRIHVSTATDAAISADTTLQSSPESDPTLQTQKAEQVEGKQYEKPRLVLKFIWMEKNIGLGLDQMLPGHGTVPLTPYFFWPRKDAWEELKTVLESKPWISQKKMIILLNQATDIINLWQQSGGGGLS